MRRAVWRLARAVERTAEERGTMMEGRVRVAAIPMGMITMRVLPPRRGEGVVPMSMVTVGVISVRVFPPRGRECVVAMRAVPMSSVAPLARPATPSRVPKTNDAVKESFEGAPKSITLRGIVLGSLLDVLLAVGHLVEQHLLELDLTFQFRNHITKELQIVVQIGRHIFPGKRRERRAIVNLVKVAVRNMSEYSRSSDIKDLNGCSR